MTLRLQIIALLLTLFYLFVIVRLVRRAEMRAKYSFLWLGVGTVIAAMTIVPGLLEGMATLVGIAYPPAIIFLAAIFLLLVVAIHFSWELSRLEERTRVLAEEIALLRAEGLHQPVDGDVSARAAQPAPSSG